MNLQAVKLDIVQKILNIKTESILSKINNILENEMIVGYTVEGKPLTKGAYNKRLQKAEEQIASGDFVTQEELEKESDNW